VIAALTPSPERRPKISGAGFMTLCTELAARNARAVRALFSNTARVQDYINVSNLRKTFTCRQKELNNIRNNYIYLPNVKL